MVKTLDQKLMAYITNHPQQMFNLVNQLVDDLIDIVLSDDSPKHEIKAFDEWARFSRQMLRYPAEPEAKFPEVAAMNNFTPSATMQKSRIPKLW